MVIIDPYAFATQGRSLDGGVSVLALPRLIPLLATDDGQEIARYTVDYSLLFGVDEGGVRGVLGTLKTTLPMVCQRCMGEMLLVVTVDVQLGMVNSRQAAQTLPESYDPLVVTDEGTTLETIIEDELILALPLVAMHEINDCSQSEAFFDKGPGQGGETDGTDRDTPKRENPFAVLAKLKTSQSK